MDRHLAWLYRRYRAAVAEGRVSEAKKIEAEVDRIHAQEERVQRLTEGRR